MEREEMNREDGERERTWAAGTEKRVEPPGREGRQGQRKRWGRCRKETHLFPSSFFSFFFSFFSFCPLPPSGLGVPGVLAVNSSVFPRANPAGRARRARRAAGGQISKPRPTG
jgi:hypothetical protein